MRCIGFLLASFGAAIVVAHPLSEIGNRGKINQNYMFATFGATNQQNSNEKTWLDIYVSSNGINFAEYAKDVYQSQKGFVRDPSIMFHNNKYYIAHTTGWTGSTIGIISSPDLRTWTPVTTIDVNTNGISAYSTWAPI